MRVFFGESDRALSSPHKGKQLWQALILTFGER
jgi:hypothetical protein